MWGRIQAGARQRETGDSGRGRGEQRQDSGQSGHGERHQPPVPISLDQDRLGDPIEPDDVKSQSEPPATAGGAGWPARALYQAQQHRHGQKQDWDGIYRWERQGCQRTGQHRDQISAPPSQRDQPGGGPPDSGG
jgi:hypothetical protein